MEHGRTPKFYDANHISFVNIFFFRSNNQKKYKAGKKRKYKIQMAESTQEPLQTAVDKLKLINNAFFKENSSDENGVVLFTTCPNQLNWRNVKKAFVDADFGWVDRVDLVPSGKFKKAYIYFEAHKWNQEKDEEYDALQHGKTLKVFYDSNRFFKVRVSNNKRITREEALKRRENKVRVEIE